MTGWTSALEPQHDEPPPVAPKPPRKGSNGRIDRARRYVAKMNAAISGQNGHGATWAVARKCAADFELNLDQTLEVLREFNVRCQPSWSERELRHKAEEACKKARVANPVEDREQHWTMPSSHYTELAGEHEYSDADVPDALRTYEAFGMDAQAKRLPLLKILGPAEIFAELAPLEYLVDQLVVRGTALQILAYGSSGKSWLGFHMAVASAAGVPFLGRFETKKCRVLYLDFENGSRESRRRIQANAKARGIAPADLQLGLCSMPTMYLDDQRFIDEIRRLASDYDLFIVDTLRAATRGEENASEARRPIDAIKAVIEETRGALVVLSHTKKVSQSVTKIDPREAGRAWCASGST